MPPDGQRSPAEEQPQQNDYRDRHTQQPQQNSSSHRLLLNPRSGRQRRAERLVPLLFGNRGQRKLDLDKRVAVSVDGLAHFGVDVASFAAARQLPLLVPDGNGASARTARAIGGMADVHEDLQELTSGRCLSST